MQRKEEKKKLRSKITTRTLLITLSLFVMLIMLACILLYGLRGEGKEFDVLFLDAEDGVLVKTL